MKSEIVAVDRERNDSFRLASLLCSNKIIAVFCECRASCPKICIKIVRSSDEHHCDSNRGTVLKKEKEIVWCLTIDCIASFYSLLEFYRCHWDFILGFYSNNSALVTNIKLINVTSEIDNLPIACITIIINDKFFLDAFSWTRFANW